MCSSKAGGKPALRARARVYGLVGWIVLAAWSPLAPASPPAVPEAAVAYAQSQFRRAQDRYRAEPANPEAAWEFGRACFDIAEIAGSRAERARTADQGIAACRRAVERASNSAPAHYYLAMNQGQLARTKGLGALKLVGQMRHEFTVAADLDEHFDYAGPDRNLGQLYRDAPSIGSIGNRALAKQHLRRAVQLAPDFPDNRLNLLEALVKWGEYDEARRELSAIEELWPKARERFTGPAWAGDWANWEQELKRLKKKVEDSSRTLESPRSRQ